MAKTRTKKPKAKQAYLDPEFEPVSIKKIDQAAENYYETMMERTVLSKEEDEKKTARIEIMKQHDLARYEFDGFVVTLTDKTNAAVKKKKQPVADDPNETAPDTEDGE